MEQATHRNHAMRTDSRIIPRTIQPLAPCRMRAGSLFPLPRIPACMKPVSRPVDRCWLEMQEFSVLDVNLLRIFQVLPFQHADDKVVKQYEVSNVR